MLQQQVYVLNTILMALDALCIIAAAYGAFYVKYYESGFFWSIDTNVFSVSVLLIMFLNNYMMGKFRLYSDRRPTSYYNLLWSILKSIAISFGVLSVGIVMLQQKQYSRLFLLAFAGLSFLFIVILRVFSQFYVDRISKKSKYARKILVVGDLERGHFVTNLLNSQLSWGHEVVGLLTTQAEEYGASESLGSIEDLPKVLRNYTVDEVVFALKKDRSIYLDPYLLTCQRMGIPVRILPGLWYQGNKLLSAEKCQGVPFLTLRTTNFNATGLLYKRVLDLTGGMVGIILLFMMYPFIATAIKIDSEGPVLFKQKRVGQQGRVFYLFKFRTMYKDAEERRQELMGNNLMNGAMFKMENDPRITRVGKWLRKTSLDEFPQFLNVIKGDMSLVGTRPPMIEEVENYKSDHFKRIAMKPGITGLWQISGRNKIADFDKVVELDCKYLDNWRFLDDLKILFKTFWVVMQRKGAL